MTFKKIVTSLFIVCYKLLKLRVLQSLKSYCIFCKSLICVNNTQASLSASTSPSSSIFGFEFGRLSWHQGLVSNTKEMLPRLQCSTLRFSLLRALHCTTAIFFEECSVRLRVPRLVTPLRIPGIVRPVGDTDMALFH